jgi:signal transduction histidine kinase/CheY-like chemotaxis protein
MGPRRLVASLSKRSQGPFASDYFREQSFVILIAMLALPAWLWLGVNLEAQRLDPFAAIVIMVLVAAGCWFTLSLYREHFAWAVGILLVCELAFVGGMLWLLRDPAIGYLFGLVVVSATMIGPFGACLTAVAAGLCEAALAFLPSPAIVPPGALAGQIMLYLLAAGVSAQVSMGLQDALASAEQSAQEASRQVEEARQRRGELGRALKSLDLAWAQLQRANSELFRAREAADEALHFKSEFAAQISHELRTSLNLVLGFSETMAFSQNSYRVKLPAPYLRDVTEIYRNSQHLLALIDDVLDLSKLDAGKMGLRREPADLAVMLREATDIAYPLIEKKGLALDHDVPGTLPLALIDHTRIRQVVLNLLSNAVRATSRGRIGVKAVRVGGEIVVEVSDTGVGISPENLERVFEEFHQVEGPQGAPGAAGLGLAVSKRIIALHGGRMWATSAEGVGSTFAFALPLPEGPVYAASVRTQGPAPLPLQPAVVLTGEPESDEVKLLQRHLEGYSILAAPTLEQAVSMAAEGGARAVIVNGAVHDIDEDLLPRQPVPLIACPLPGPEQVRRRMGVSCFLQKPITGEAIRSALRRVAPGAQKVLVVDDDPAAVRLTERMLQGSEPARELSRAYSGREALVRVRAQLPDAIVLDLAMQDGDGQWLISALRQETSTAGIPILVTTGRPVEEVWRSGSIGVLSGIGFTPTETLRYLLALLSVVPSSMARGGNAAPPSSAEHPE